MQKKIARQGVISAIEEKQIRVMILAESACAACHAKGACTMADVSEKEIIINQRSELNNLKPGDKVWVEMPEKQGTTAIIWAYVLPVVLILMVLFILSGKVSEGMAGVGVLLFLVLYYSALWLLRPFIEKKYKFSLRPMTEEESQTIECSSALFPTR
ncbi:MAG: SoxR reducing system RseC family protein [Bacteroidales bacterium]